MKFKCLIVDDDARSSWLLKSMLEEIEDIEIAGMASDGEKALEAAETMQPDIVFMDIVMPGMNGMEASVKLKKGKQLPLIALITGYEDEYVKMGYKANATAFIPKPVNSEQLSSEVERLKENVRVIKESSLEYICADIDRLRTNLKERLEASEYIRIKIKGEDKHFCVRDIVSFYTEAGYLFMKYGSGKPQRVMPSMKDIVTKMTEHFFVQAHRGFLISIRHISEIEHYGKKAYRIYMDDGSIVPVGRKYIKTIKGVESLLQVLRKEL